MPEAGLSVSRGQTRRGEDRSDSASGARHAYASPRPVRAGPSDPVDDRGIVRDRDPAGLVAANSRSGGRAAANGSARRVAANGDSVRRVSANGDSVRRTVPNGARDRVTRRDRARPGPREAPRPGSRGAVRRERAVVDPRQPTRHADRMPSAPAGAAVDGRRTVRIQGRGAERYSPPPARRRPHRRPHERDGFKPDRAAMWAVLLGVVLILVAATSSHAAVRSRVAASAHARVALHAAPDARAHVRTVSRRGHGSRRSCRLGRGRSRHVRCGRSVLLSRHRYPTSPGDPDHSRDTDARGRWAVADRPRDALNPDLRNPERLMIERLSRCV
jgi:hypothetical protein